MTEACLRLCDRYLNEVVLAFGLCPWAEPALRAGQVGRSVCLNEPVQLDEVLSGIDAFEAAHAPVVEIGLLLFPRFTGGWAAFDSFGERVRRADRARRAPPSLPPFLIATFHPDGADSLSHPNRLLSFIRRSPDPLLQLVRASTVYDLKDRHPTLSDDVAHRNWTTLTERTEGGATNADALASAVEAIHRDRAATYNRLSAEGPRTSGL